MDSFLRRLQFRILPSILNRKQYKIWRHQQSKQNNNNSTHIYGRSFQTSSESRRIEMENQFMSHKNQQCSGVGQVPRCFKSTDARSNYRHWESAKADAAAKHTTQSDGAIGLPIRIVSYNILAQSLLVKHLHLYSLCNQLHLKWSHRLAKLSQEILAQRPDILCLQEVQEDHLGEIITSITGKLPMTCLFKKKTGFLSDGCAIMYNKNLFDIVASEAVECYQPGFDLLDRHNIGLIAKLRCKSRPKVTFLVCTTHLLYNPARQDVRLAQLMVLLAELDRYSVVRTAESSELQRMPIILTGDFNFKPDSAPFELITRGKLCYEELSRKYLTEPNNEGTLPTGKRFISPQLGITDNCQHIDCITSDYKHATCRLHNTVKDLSNNENQLTSESNPALFSTGTLTHGLNLKSVYNHFGTQSFGSTFQNEWVTVDHLFYSQPERKNSHQGYLNLMSVYQLPTVQQCHNIGPIPNENLGSDHLMLASNLYLTFPVES